MIEYLPYILSLPYASLMAYISLGLYKKKYNLNKTDAENKISVTLIVACRNEETNLSNLIKSIDHQIYMPDNIILVDDNSTDKTLAILNSYAEKNNKVKIIKSNGRGKKTALLQAANYAVTDYLMFTDADCILNKFHTCLAVDFLNKNNSDLLIGGVDIVDNKSFFNFIEQIEFLSLQATTAGAALLKNPFMCNGANLIVKRNLYLKNQYNIHNEIASGDDVFILHSLKQNNCKIDYLYNKDFVVKTKGSSNIFDFIKQRIRWSGKTSLYKDYFTIVVAFIVVATNFILCLSYFITPIIYIIKILADSAVMIPYLLKYNHNKILKYYAFIFPIMSVIYPFYIITIGIISIFTSNKYINWK